jgi:beta-glucosidase
MSNPARFASLMLAVVLTSASAVAQQGVPIVSQSQPSPDERAARLIEQMTLDEKFSLLHGHFPRMMKTLPADAAPSGGYFPGLPRLGIPALRETDAGLGVAENGPYGNAATALPSGASLASTWDTAIAHAAGAMVGKQTRQRGYNILLSGGVNLVRDAFNGRNFEYLGEDPLLAGRLAGASISGVQSRHIASTVKHFALNAQETGRHAIDARIDEAALRESDLLAFQFAIEDGQPASVMCAYNKVNGRHACENPNLLTSVLRSDWGWKGWVMSDWGAVHSVAAANAGLDQESGQELDKEVYFGEPLKTAVLAGTVSQARVDEMVHRILRSLFAVGAIDPQPSLGPLDLPGDNAVALRAAEAGIVVLRNDGNILPLTASAGRIAVIGGHAEIGVLSGGGSSQVMPEGSIRLPVPPGYPASARGPVYHPSAPLEAIKRRALGEVSFDPGTDIASAVAAARKADLAIVFAEQWALEGVDIETRLSEHQEALIAAVAAANPHTVVVLETGGPVIMPWRKKVTGLIEAWYPGGAGGEAIARILFGEVNPSGRLPVTFAEGVGQLPRPAPIGLDVNPVQPRHFWESKPFAVDYFEGSSVGYRWFAAQAYKPAYPFGYGLSYTTFHYTRLSVVDDEPLRVKLTITNTGSRAGRETAQLYLREAPARRQQRLLGWAQADLQPGESKIVEITVDPRLLADWDTRLGRWRVDGGRYRLFAGPNAGAAALETTVSLRPATISP